jgi:hypothetical protein
MNATLTGVVMDGSGSTVQTAQSFSIPQGEAFTLTVSVKGQDGTAFNLNDYTSATLTARKTKFTGSVLFALDGVITDPLNGVIVFSGVEADTVDATAGAYVFDAWITNSNTDDSYRIICEKDADGNHSICTIEGAVTELP